MIKIKRNCKEIEGESFGAKSERKQSKNRAKTRAKTGVCEISQPLRNRHFAAKPVRNLRPLSTKIFAAAKPLLAHECHFAAQEHLFRSCETHCEVKKADFATKVPFRKGFRGCESTFGTRVPFRSTVTLISQLRKGCEVPKLKNPNFIVAPPFRQLLDTSRSLPEVQIMHSISRFNAWEVTSIASNGARFGFETEKLSPFEDDCANHERKCRTSILLLLDTFLKYFLELKLCIR